MALPIIASHAVRLSIISSACQHGAGQPPSPSLEMLRHCSTGVSIASTPKPHSSAARHCSAAVASRYVADAASPVLSRQLLAL
jgi:hypothetical protein